MNEIIKGVIMTPLQSLERIIKNVQAYTNIDIEQELDTIAEALHVPTADEVCEELGKYLETKVMYQKGKYEDGGVILTWVSFYYCREKKDMNGNDYVLKTPIATGDKTGININATLTPHLITLISRFYEAQE